MAEDFGELDFSLLWADGYALDIFNSDYSGQSKAKSPKTSSVGADDKQKEQKTEGVECRKRDRAAEVKMGKTSCGKGKGILGESDHEIHNSREKERRKKMSELFRTLHELLPHFNHKVIKLMVF